MATEKSSSASSDSKRSGSSSSKKAARKPAARKTTTSSSDGGGRRPSAPRAEASRKASGPLIAEAAVRQLAELTTKQIEGVTALEKSDDGWIVQVEVLELSRIPSTTDVLGSYEVMLDSSGDLEGYRRVRRFVRGSAEDGA